MLSLCHPSHLSNFKSVVSCPCPIPYTLSPEAATVAAPQQGPPIQGRLWRESSKEPGTYFHDKPKQILGTYQTALGSTTPTQAHLRGEGQNGDSLRWWCSCRTGETAMAAFFPTRSGGGAIAWDGGPHGSESERVREGVKNSNGGGAVTRTVYYFIYYCLQRRRKKN